MKLNDRQLKAYGEMTLWFVEALKEGKGCWKRRWASAYKEHQNGVSKHVFSGWNPFWLTLASSRFGWVSPLWATWKQWMSVGGVTPKDAIGVTLLQPVFVKKQVEEGKPAESRLVGWRDYQVFNRELVLGLPEEPVVPAYVEHTRADVLSFVEGTHARVRNGSEMPCFIPGKDEIQMPALAQFEQPDFYYSTLFHELVHWTGHKDRLDRLRARRDPVAYAREELIAELGSAFLCADFHVEPDEGREDHAGYLAEWVRWLPEEPDALMFAGRAAASACGYLHKLSDENVRKERLTA